MLKIYWWAALILLAQPAFGQTNVEDALKTNHIVPVCVYSYPISLEDFTCRDYQSTQLVDRVCFNRRASQLAVKPHNNDNYMLHCNIKVVGDNILMLLHAPDDRIDDLYSAFRSTLTSDNRCANPWNPNY